jgi:dienelactone hydrolase
LSLSHIEDLPAANVSAHRPLKTLLGARQSKRAGGFPPSLRCVSFPALRAAGKKVTDFNYDTSAERYNRQAADLAWKRALAFFRRYLA